MAIYVIFGIVFGILVPGIYFGIVAAIAITVCRALLKER